jgi:hypothetical protein
MNFFTPVTKPSLGTQETMVKERVGWSKGLKGLYAHTEEHRAKMSRAMKGVNKGRVKSPETLAKLAANKAAYYATHSGTMKGKKHSEESRAKMVLTRSVVKPMLGKKHTAEVIAKMSAIKKGKKHTAESRAKMSATQKGKPKPKWSAESRARFSASKATPVMTPHGLFPSIRAVAEASGRDGSTVRTWLRKFPEHYFYLD